MRIRKRFFNPQAEIRIPQLNYSVSYSATLQDHLAHPRNAGELADANAVAELTNPVCGDRLRLMLRVVNNRIAAARFLAYGCPPTIACGSAITELLTGLTTTEAAALTRQDLARALDGLPARKTHAAALAIETLHAALDQFPT
jgi:nitrogen fixation NifU-like protein